MRRSAEQWVVEPYTHSDLDELRRGTLDVVLATAPAVVVLLTVLLAFEYGGEQARLIVVPPALAFVVAVAYLVSHRSRVAAAWTLVVGLLLLAGFTTLVAPQASPSGLVALAVLVAAATLGPGAIGPAAALATATLTVGHFAAWPALPSEVTVVATLQVWTCAGLSWLIARPTQTALQWAWNSYDQTLRLAQEARERQASLGRTVKSLNEAYEHLERLNTELVRARLVAEEARRVKAEFATNISHELRTPLNLIIGFTELMVASPQAYQGERLPDAYRADVDAVYRSAQHLRALIDDVLDLSQLDVSRAGLRREAAALVEVVQEACSTAGPLVTNRGLSLGVDVSADIPGVSIDRTRIRQVLINLLTNAARFTDEGGVRVTASRREGDIVVAVADTGIGIPAESLPVVFEEFRQVDGSLRRRAGGSGLGLSISKRFIELHGGSMWVESEVGRGTTFYFTLPLASAVVAGVYTRETRAPGPPPLAGDERPVLLVAGASPSVGGIFERYLDGYRVTTVATLEEAGKLARDRAVCAAVVVATSRQLAWQHLDADALGELGVPVIACSLPGTRDRADELGIAAYLGKPVMREQLLRAFLGLGRRVRSILIVDDDPEMVRLLARMVRSFRRGYQIWRACGGTEALAILRERRPDAILLDLLMPDVDGYAVLEHLRSEERLRGVQVVAVTAHGGVEPELTADLVGITRRGGLSAGELMRSLRRYLDGLLEAPGPPAPPEGVARRPPGARPA